MANRLRDYSHKILNKYTKTKGLLADSKDTAQVYLIQGPTCRLFKVPCHILTTCQYNDPVVVVCSLKLSYSIDNQRIIV